MNKMLTRNKSEHHYLETMAVSSKMREGIEKIINNYVEEKCRKGYIVTDVKMMVHGEMLLLTVFGYDDNLLRR